MTTPASTTAGARGGTAAPPPGPARRFAPLTDAGWRPLFDLPRVVGGLGPDRRAERRKAPRQRLAAITEIAASLRWQSTVIADAPLAVKA